MSNVKNVEAFEKLLGLCAGYGDKYNPARPNLRVENMSSLLAAARSVLQDVGAAKTGYDNATTAREQAYSDLDRLAMRILSELKSSGAPSQTINDANSMVRKITGNRAQGRPPVSQPITSAPASNEVKASAVPRQKPVARGGDFGSMAQHFEKLLQTVSAEPTYQPNTADLQVRALSDRLQRLHQGNTAVVQANSVLSEARKKRNGVLYGNDQNLFVTARAAQQQVKASFGHASEAFKEVRKIRFTKPIK